MPELTDVSNGILMGCIGCPTKLYDEVDTGFDSGICDTGEGRTFLNARHHSR